MRRARMILVAGALLALAAPAAARAADVTVIYPRGGGSQTVSLESLAGSFDVDAQYDLVSASGQTTSKQIHGISLASLLAAARADNTYSAVEISRPGGGSVRVSRTQIEAGGLGPVVYQDGGNATFLRPSYRSGDQNAGDVVSASPLVIKQVDDNKFNLKAKASTLKGKVGQSIKFSATAEGAAGEKLRFSWTFDDGSDGASGAVVSHRFKQRGYYRVLATVRGDAEFPSYSVVLKMQIGKAAKSDKNREGGGTNNASGAPISGQADGGSGSGDTAGTTAPAKPRTAKKKAQPQQADAGLETVSGELLTSPTPEQQSALAARTGQQAKPQPASGGGIPDDAYGVAAALALLGFGAALEFGGFGGLRRKFS